MIVMALTFHGTKLSTMLFLDDVNIIIFLVFEMWIAINEFDHHVLLLLKQQ